MSAGAPRVYHRCARCGRKQEVINSGKFRVNANGSLIDVWLIFRCKKCKQTWNLTVYERVRASKVPPEEYERFLQNDPDMDSRPDAYASGRLFAVAAVPGVFIPAGRGR